MSTKMRNFIVFGVIAVFLTSMLPIIGCGSTAKETGAANSPTPGGSPTTTGITVSGTVSVDSSDLMAIGATSVSSLKPNDKRVLRPLAASGGTCYAYKVDSSGNLEDLKISATVSSNGNYTLANVPENEVVTIKYVKEGSNGKAVAQECTVVTALEEGASSVSAPINKETTYTSAALFEDNDVKNLLKTISSAISDATIKELVMKTVKTLIDVVVAKVTPKIESGDLANTSVVVTATAVTGATNLAKKITEVNTNLKDVANAFESDTELKGGFTAMKIAMEGETTSKSSLDNSIAFITNIFREMSGGQMDPRREMGTIKILARAHYQGTTVTIGQLIAAMSAAGTSIDSASFLSSLNSSISSFNQQQAAVVAGTGTASSFSIPPVIASVIKSLIDLGTLTESTQVRVPQAMLIVEKMMASATSEPKMDQFMIELGLATADELEENMGGSNGLYANIDVHAFPYFNYNEFSDPNSPPQDVQALLVFAQVSGPNVSSLSSQIIAKLTYPKADGSTGTANFVRQLQQSPPPPGDQYGPPPNQTILSLRSEDGGMMGIQFQIDPYGGDKGSYSDSSKLVISDFVSGTFTFTLYDGNQVLLTKSVTQTFADFSQTRLTLISPKADVFGIYAQATVYPSGTYPQFEWSATGLPAGNVKYKIMVFSNTSHQPVWDSGWNHTYVSGTSYKLSKIMVNGQESTSIPDGEYNLEILAVALDDYGFEINAGAVARASFSIGEINYQQGQYSEVTIPAFSGTITPSAGSTTDLKVGLFTFTRNGRILVKAGTVREDRTYAIDITLAELAAKATTLSVNRLELMVLAWEDTNGDGALKEPTDFTQKISEGDIEHNAPPVNMNWMFYEKPDLYYGGERVGESTDLSGLNINLDFSMMFSPETNILK